MVWRGKTIFKCKSMQSSFIHIKQFRHGLPFASVYFPPFLIVCCALRLADVWSKFLNLFHFYRITPYTRCDNENMHHFKFLCVAQKNVHTLHRVLIFNVCRSFLHVPRCLIAVCSRCVSHETNKIAWGFSAKLVLAFRLLVISHALD